MATEKQKTAARRNLREARQAQSDRARGKSVRRRTSGLSTASENRLKDSQFAFPEQRKEPLIDARHVRNAVARFDQVEIIKGDSHHESTKQEVLNRLQGEPLDFLFLDGDHTLAGVSLDYQLYAPLVRSVTG